MLLPPDLADHLGITERAMDVMDMLRQRYQADDVEHVQHPSSPATSRAATVHS